MTTHLPALTPASREGRSFRLLTIATFLAVMFAPTAYAQAPAAAAGVAAAPSPAQLEKLVDRIALYPDDLVSIILPASTNPLQLVQAERFLEKRKTDPKAPVDEKWDDAVKSLVNYPEVVKAMSSDLDWTSALGEAVVADQGAVLEAIQVFRRKTQAVGNLKSDAKQTVVVEKEVIKIVPADPQVIYVPQYNPSTVVVSGGYSSWGYYPAPYPVYYYPYPPGAALATGLIWGAAIGAAWNGNRYNSNWGGGGNNSININNSTNISRGGNTVNRPATGTGQRPGAGAGSGSSQWKPSKQPGQVSGSIGKPSGGGRVGDARPSAGGGAYGGGSRPSSQPAGGGRDFGGGSRPSTQPAGGGRDQGGGAFSGSSASGRQTQMDSSRGAASRSSMSGAGGGRSGASAGSFGGGGARAGAGGGGGGGARAGGGGGGGGARAGGGGGGGRGGGGRR